MYQVYVHPLKEKYVFTLSIVERECAVAAVCIGSFHSCAFFVSCVSGGKAYEHFPDEF